MRQLDLFGSVFETPSPEIKPGENKEASNKEESAVAAEAAEPYSKNFLGSERQASSDVAITIEQNKVEIDVSQNSPAGAAPAPILLSLFDVPFPAKNPEPAKQEFKVDVQEPLPEISVAETFIGEIAETNFSISVIADEPAIPTAKDEIEIADEPAASVPATKVKKAEKSKQKNQKAPELERNGSVIFDDGKISVKIKNKNPFPPPVVKEKKEKVKKPLQKRGRKSFKEIDAEVDLIEIPEDEVLFQKQYYGISEVAKWFRVNTSLLRFWENEFDVLKPRKNRKGDRLFRPEDVKNLQLIYQLLRQRKYTIEGAKEYIKTNKKKADIQLQLTNTLQKFKSFLLDLKANLQP